jgi:hypothetical protein
MLGVMFTSLLDRRIGQIIIDLDMLILGDLVGFVGIAVKIIKGCSLTRSFKFCLLVLVTNDDVAGSDGGAHFPPGIIELIISKNYSTNNYNIKEIKFI